ncbi:MAG TPA: M15 family metallopeptidase [Gaiellaceae bacterium]|nr:M15 family metallopeptidase [Gaiellaceae bacterium]
MLRRCLLIASLALVGTACGAGAPSDEARTSSRSSRSRSPGTTSTAPPSSTSASAETTSAPPSSTSPPAETTTAPPEAEPAPDPASPPANGQLPDASLTTVTPSCRILNDLAPRLRSLLDAAHADGIALLPETQPYTTGATPPRLTSCYRDLAMQQWWRDYYCGQGSCGMAAVPGTSVHGWGRAVDFEEGGQELAFDMDGYEWLVAHASAFGFAQPGWAGPSGTGPEPWHWEAS